MLDLIPGCLLVEVVLRFPVREAEAGELRKDGKGGSRYREVNL